MAMQLLSCNHGVIDLDIQGHRGCRGLMPENTIPAFQKAVAIGVTTLELDVVISKDKKVVVSHEPWFASAFCLDPAGNAIDSANAQKHNIYAMDYAEIADWDCGRKGNSRFPEQQKLAAQKPLLSAVFETIESDLDAKNGADEYRQLPHYNIEIKMENGGIGVFNPDAKEFVTLVLEEIQSHNLLTRCTIQSFEIEALRAARRQSSTVSVGLLIDDNENYKDKISALGFYPNVLSPDWHLVDQDMLAFAAEKNMKVVAWTVNEPEDMRKVIRLGVHGVITDYPDRLVALLEEL